MSSTPRLRCAVYTRKSTEEGLDQEFNSLDAQFEACAAYVASQAGLGWRLVADRYDDGGISGGTMDRPALQRLLQDIRDNKVDVVVVYKIDRLTRSLMDFSRIVEVFDQAGASFVSVTQQFNTTTSMGRLTLNVLLSFAQFEREVTAERIRDKIAASKKKGMWMGGVVPLGYRVENRKLIIDEREAATIRWLFSRYLELRSVRALVDEAKEQQLIGRTREADDGSPIPVTTFGRGNLYHLLSNPIYIGKIKHRDNAYDGEHEAIIASDVFAAAQALLQSQAPQRRQAKNAEDVHLLTGMLFDEVGDKLRATHAATRGTRYRYYVSKELIEGRKKNETGWRLPAREIESLVEHQLSRVLQDRPQLADWIQRFAPATSITAALDHAPDVLRELCGSEAGRRRSIIRAMVKRMTLGRGELKLEVDPQGLVALIADMEPQAAVDALGDGLVAIACPITLRRRGVELRMVLNDGAAPAHAPDRALIDLVLRAQHYLAMLTDGQDRSLTDVASAEGTELSEVSRLLPLAFLSPKIVDRILAGTQPVNLTAQTLSRIAGLPVSWPQQEQRLLA
jgi:DNA invertase Pin-like site-specific DNA recombinase